MNNDWPEARMARLKELFEADYTHGKSALKLSEEAGFLITRNSVCGKVNRMDSADPFGALNKLRKSLIQMPPEHRIDSGDPVRG